MSVYAAGGGSWAPASQIFMGEQELDLPLLTSEGGGGLYSFANPLGIDLLLTSVEVDVVAPIFGP